MDLANLIIAFGLLVITGVAALAAFVQARTAIEAKKDAESAQRKAEGARDEAVELARQANEAFVRQADAQERANQIAMEGRSFADLKWRSTMETQVDTVMNGHGDPEDFQALDLIITNRGSGVALNVRVGIVGAADVVERELGAIQLDEKKSARFNAMLPTVPWPGQFKLTWREPSSREFEEIIQYGPTITHEYY